ncbi:MAG: hypothetical protein JXO44_14435 [Clostridia bacterium]|nr:hypothetical protein [Clostridia bacterium]
MKKHNMTNTFNPEQESTLMREGMDIMQCSLCESTASLKPFGNAFICETCIAYVKKAQND